MRGENRCIAPVDRQCRHGHRFPTGGTLQIHVPSGCAEARAGFAPADYKREDYQIERLHRIAVDAGLDPDIAEMYREFVVTEAKRRHKRIAENGVDPGVLDVFA